MKKTDGQFKRIAGLLSRCLRTLRQAPVALGLLWSADPVGTVLTQLASLAHGIMPAVYLYCSKEVIDSVTQWLGTKGGIPHSAVFFLVVAGAALLTQEATGLLLGSYMSERLSRRIAIRIRELLLDKAAQLDVTFFETPEFHDRLMRAQQQSMGRPTSMAATLTGGLADLVGLLAYVVVLWQFSPWSLLILVAVTAPVLAVELGFGHLGYVTVTGQTEGERRIGYISNLLTSPAAAKEVRLFGLFPYLREAWSGLCQRHCRQKDSVALRRGVSRLVVVLFRVGLTFAFYVAVVARTARDPAMTVGAMIMVVQAMKLACGALAGVSRAAGSFYADSLFFADLVEFLKLQPTLQSASGPVSSVPLLGQCVEFRSVGFAYPAAESRVLEDVSFRIESGERIAVVGENGAGKTTLVKLLARLYDPCTGSIEVDGVDLRGIPPETWQQNMAVIFQDFVRYHLSVRENIAFGDLTKLDCDEALLRAARLSGADRTLAALPQGLDAKLGKEFSDGHEISGGEWQKIALARAFLRDARLLILDEPTASLDPKQEFETFQRFGELAQGKTVVFVSHRLSTVRTADRILVMEKGRLVEAGTHDELMAAGGVYSALFTRQAAGYQDQRGQDGNPSASDPS